MADDAKRALRTKMKTIRSELGAEARAEADALIAAGVLSLPEYAKAELILAYLDFRPEVRTRDIICQAWAQGKTVALPRCVPGTRQMRWYEVESLEGLIRSPLGVEEPDPQAAPELDLAMAGPAIALVPGLAFDAQGYRLGYGGGFYDGFLSGFEGVSVGLCREAQFMDDLGAAGVVEGHDLPVSIIVTDARIIRI